MAWQQFSRDGTPREGFTRDGSFRGSKIRNSTARVTSTCRQANGAFRVYLADGSHKDLPPGVPIQSILG